MKGKKLMAFFIVAALVIVSSFFIFSLKLETTFYNIKSDKINEKIRIVQISDLHCDRFGKNQEKLIKEIEKLAPDLITLSRENAFISSSIVNSSCSVPGFHPSRARRFTKASG